MASPSSLEGGGKVHIGSRFDGQTNVGMCLGTVTHAWFESIEWLGDEIPTREALLGTVPLEETALLGKEQLVGAAERFIHAIQDGAVRDLLTKPNGHLEVFNEQTFAVRVPKETRFARVSMKEMTDIQGSIDRLVVYYDELNNPVKAEVIDWKTDSFDPHEKEEKIEQYAPQIATYQIAAAKLLGIDQEAVEAKLVFVKTREIVDMPKKTRCNVS
jgi:ATP-dependent exoDNAse (exonuclease V) beta subunit